MSNLAIVISQSFLTDGIQKRFMELGILFFLINENIFLEKSMAKLFARGRLNFGTGITYYFQTRDGISGPEHINGLFGHMALFTWPRFLVSTTTSIHNLFEKIDLELMHNYFSELNLIFLCL